MERIPVDRRSLLKWTAASAALAPVLAQASLLEAAQANPPANAAPHQPAAPAAPRATLNARDYGAKGDGVAKDTAALQETIQRCSMLGGGVVTLSAGKYLTGTLALRSGVTLHLEKDAELLGSPDMADYPLTQVRWEGKWRQGYSALITAEDAQNIALTGPGSITGSSAIRGRIERPSGHRLPALIELINCRHVSVQDLTTTQYGMWSTHPVYCEDVVFRNLVVNSGADGIDVDSCRRVLIDGCTFTTADDCISLKSGRGMEGNTIARPTENVTITRCSFADSWFACIGIGSETSAGIRNVRVSDCRFLGARSYAVYIKTRVGRGAFLENIHMSNLDVSGARQGFLRLNFTNSGKHDEVPVPGEAGIPTVRNLSFSNVHVHDVPVLVEAKEIDPLKPLDGFTLSNITGTCTRGIFLAYARRVALSGIKVTGFEGRLLNTLHVSGVGLAGAVPIPADQMPAVPEPSPAPATPYRLS